MLALLAHAQQRRPKFKYRTTTQSPFENLDVIIQNAANQFWIYFLVGALVAIVLILIVKSCYSHFCKTTHSASMKLFLALQIATATEALVIKIVELHGVASDFVLICDNICTQIRVQGYCGRWLTYIWKANVLDIFNFKETKIPEKVALNLIESFKLRHLLAEVFTIKPVILSKGQILPIVVTPNIANIKPSQSIVSLRAIGASRYSIFAACNEQQTERDNRL